jgi:GNAT superfamily N-acetyltransferase
MSPELAFRPIDPHDRTPIVTVFDGLSEHSRYLRYLGPKLRLSDAEIRYFTEVDHHDHEALVAIEPGTGDGIGVARYVRREGDPTAAELAVAVIDDWQRRGIGSRLTSALADRARAEGVTTFTALMLAENEQMLSLLDELGRTRITSRERGTVEVSVDLTPGELERLKGMFRRVGRGELTPLAPWHLSRPWVRER